MKVMFACKKERLAIPAPKTRDEDDVNLVLFLGDEPMAVVREDDDEPVPDDAELKIELHSGGGPDEKTRGAQVRTIWQEAQ